MMYITMSHIVEVVTYSEVKFVSDDIDNSICVFDVMMASLHAQQIGIEQRLEFRFDLNDMNIAGRSADGRKFDYSMRLGIPFGPPDELPAYSRCRSKPNEFIADILYSALYEQSERRQTVISENGPHPGASFQG
ncbi:hypothetical protein [Mesorhizobium sp. M0011]|uniref:hypothetical protein n=1 Tax=Mesorhizobium sp. M0011 TaxID=2956839 RepID=UPI0033360E07